MLISENYINRLEGFSKIPVESRANYIHRFIDAQFGEDSSKSVDIRNSVLHDFYHLLLGSWNKSTSLHTNLTDIIKLDPQALNCVRAELGESKVIDLLQHHLQVAQQDTVITFDEFFNRAKAIEFSNEGEFLRWYYNSLPYLVVDIKKNELACDTPKHQEKMEEIYRRINDVLDLYPNISTERLKLDESAMGYVYRWIQQP
jgi:hypothetical protein